MAETGWQGLGHRQIKWHGTLVTDALIVNGLPILPSAVTVGSVLFVGSSGQVAEDNANFFWDDTNNRLGIGTNAPLGSLYVSYSTSSEYPRVRRVSNGAATFGVGNSEGEAQFHVDNDVLTIESPGSGYNFSVGNVGIGTTSPTYDLDIGVGGSGSNDRVLRINTGTDDAARAYQRFERDGSLKAIIGIAGAGGSGLAPNTSKDDLVFRAQTQKIVFTPDGGSTTALAIATNSKVGVGTTVPAFTFTVSGGATAQYGINNSGGISASVTSADLAGKTMLFSGGILVGYG